MDKIEILGSKISSFESYDEVYNAIKGYQDQPSYITVNNVHTITVGINNPYYLDIINDSLYALPDGRPLSLYSKLYGQNKCIRIFGPTLFEKIIEWGQKDNLKHFFFGSSSYILTKLIHNISMKFPSAIITGYYSPPYKSRFNEKENKQFIEIMNKCGADIIWIGLGAPKQELWMYENYKKLDKGIMIGIGAGFDYLAGNIKHAPEWMKSASLEWLYRLIQEPRRLWKRYLITNSLFIWYIFLKMIGLKKFN